MLNDHNAKALSTLLSRSTTLLAWTKARPPIKDFADAASKVLGSNPKSQNLMLYASSFSLNDLRYYWPASVMSNLSVDYAHCGVYHRAMMMYVLSDVGLPVGRRHNGFWLSLLSVPDEEAAKLERRVHNLP